MARKYANIRTCGGECDPAVARALPAVQGTRHREVDLEGWARARAEHAVWLHAELADMAIPVVDVDGEGRLRCVLHARQTVSISAVKMARVNGGTYGVCVPVVLGLGLDVLDLGDGKGQPCRQRGELKRNCDVAGCHFSG